MNLLVIKNHSLTFRGGRHDSRTRDQFDHVSTVKINPIKVREKKWFLITHIYILFRNSSLHLNSVRHLIDWFFKKYRPKTVHVSCLVISSERQLHNVYIHLALSAV